MSDVTVLVFTDGRSDCLRRTIPSFLEAWDPRVKIERSIIINDSADEEFTAWLDEQFPEWEKVHHSTRRGFGGAIQSGWDHVETDWVFHLEDDFLFGRQQDESFVTVPIPASDMIKVLEARGPNLIQLALKRQPWNDEEREAGDLMRVHPESWDEQIAYVDNHYPVSWCEQRMFFTTNPSIYRGELTEHGWPQVQFSEGIFSHLLMKDPVVRFGMMGWRDDPPRVFHIGNERVGTGY